MVKEILEINGERVFAETSPPTHQEGVDVEQFERTNGQGLPYKAYQMQRAVPQIGKTRTDVDYNIQELYIHAGYGHDMLARFPGPTYFDMLDEFRENYDYETPFELIDDRLDQEDWELLAERYEEMEGEELLDQETDYDWSDTGELAGAPGAIHRLNIHVLEEKGIHELRDSYPMLEEDLAEVERQAESLERILKKVERL